PIFLTPTSQTFHVHQCARGRVGFEMREIYRSQASCIVAHGTAPSHSSCQPPCIGHLLAGPGTFRPHCKISRMRMSLAVQSGGAKCVMDALSMPRYESPPLWRTVEWVWDDGAG
ncbi:hypothetical protein BaRGS_00014128, partial [Batillaria attramentaria]